MRKTMMLVALVAGSAAAKQNGKNRATYNFKGTLVEVAPDGSSVSVNVTDGNGRGRRRGARPVQGGKECDHLRRAQDLGRERRGLASARQPAWIPRRGPYSLCG